MPDRLDIGAMRVEGGYFIKRVGRDRVPYRPAPAPGAAYRHCFTYLDSPQTIRRDLLDLVRNARRKIFIASFFIGDKELNAELIAAAERLRGGVYVISALDERSLSRGLAELEERPGADRAERKRFDELTAEGIYVRGHENCHAKFAVVDDEVALVSSANFVTRAFEKTGETGVTITDPPEVDRLARFFARLWHRGCSWEMRPVSRGENYALERLKGTRTWAVPVPQPATDQAPGVIWTDGDEHHILAHLRAIVDSARQELLLATWSLNGMLKNRGLIMDRIIAATGRGVRTRILIRSFNDRLGHRQEAAVLADAGVEIAADSLTHVKCAIADRAVGAMFSANFDAQHGLTNGVEVGCRLDGTPALAEAVSYLTHAMDHADRAFVQHPAQRDLHDHLEYPELQTWPLPREARVQAAADEWAALGRAAGTAPVLFTRRDGTGGAGGADGVNGGDGADGGDGGGRSVDIGAAGRCWRLTETADGAYRLDPQGEPAMTSTRRFTDWMHGRRGAARDDPGGICPAILVRVP